MPSGATERSTILGWQETANSHADQLLAPKGVTFFIQPESP
jgi:hypothetical protein